MAGKEGLRDEDKVICEEDGQSAAGFDIGRMPGDVFGESVYDPQRGKVYPDRGPGRGTGGCGLYYGAGLRRQA